jgi:hypothetical protein
MTRYTVTYAESAYGDLAREWHNAPNRQDGTQASFEIERLLQHNALQKGEEVHEGMRRLIVSPLVAQFTVHDDDRIVTVWSLGPHHEES